MAKKLSVVLALVLLSLWAASSLGRVTPSLAVVTAGPDVGGKIAFARGGALWIYEGGQTRQLTQGPKDEQDKRDASPAFSPDGSQIAYTRFDEGFSDIYRLDVADPDDPTSLTNHRPESETGSQGYNLEALWALHPAWSPDGTTIAFTMDRGTEYPGLFDMDTEGDNVVRLENLNHGVQAVEHPSYSPDSRKIAVANYVTNNGKGQIWVLDIRAGTWTEITDAKSGAYDPAWSPDGEWIAFTMREGDRHDIYVVPTDASTWEDDYPEPIRLTTDGASRAPAWSPRGDRLAFLSLRNGSFDIFAGTVKSTRTGRFTLESVQQLTENAAIDAPSRITWGR